jgi:hypothetical protein
MARVKSKTRQIRKDNRASDFLLLPNPELFKTAVDVF